MSCVDQTSLRGSRDERSPATLGAASVALFGGIGESNCYLILRKELNHEVDRLEIGQFVDFITFGNC